MSWTFGRDATLDALEARWDDTRSYNRRPVEWVSERAGDTLWSAQRRIAESVRDNRYTAVPSAHDLGKSAAAARIGAWWIDSHPAGDAFLVTTAPTAAQVAAILWREIGRVHRAAKLRGRVTRAGYPQWHISDELVGYGRKPADYEDNAFQGIHALHVLVIADEANGVPKHLFNAIDALVTNEYARVLAIGNPDDPGSHFATICKPASGWNVIHLDGLRSPNMSRAAIIGDESSLDPRGEPYGDANPRYPLTAALMRAEGINFATEEIPPQLSPLLLSPLWVEERLARWGGISHDRDTIIDLYNYEPDKLEETVRRRADQSPLIQAKVRGIFPTSTATGVIPLGWVEYAINRWRDWKDGGGTIADMRDPTDKVLGVDVAYTGQDETVIAVRHGEIVTELHRYRHADTQETAEYAAAHMHEPGTVAVVDIIGIGAGVFDSLRRWHRAANPVTGERLAGRSIAFNASAASHKSDMIGEFRFRNDRAAAWWHMRELLDPSRGSRIMLPDDERLKEELVAVKYELLIGVIKVESKDDIKARLGRSTDTADAVIQAFWTKGRTAVALGEDTGQLQRPQPNAPRHGIVDYKVNGQTYKPLTEADFDDSSIGLSWLAKHRASEDY